jgi:ribosomal protein S18 acetylase RimI-like enzyme
MPTPYLRQVLSSTVHPDRKTPVQPLVAELSAAQLRARMQEALLIYVEAMGYPRPVAAVRAPMWAEHALRPGWRAVGAFAAPPNPAPGNLGPGSPGSGSANHFGSAPAGPSGALVGIAYGYRGAGDQWWHRQVRRGLPDHSPDPQRTEAMLQDYFGLTELHVHPQAQGHGLGESLARALLAPCAERAVLLSTPEAGAERNRAWRLYRRLGFFDVLREFTFQGDHRPFAVLGRQLPLS